jgi:hypothetical protein
LTLTRLRLADADKSRESEIRESESLRKNMTLATKNTRIENRETERAAMRRKCWTTSRRLTTLTLADADKKPRTENRDSRSGIRN